MRPTALHASDRPLILGHRGASAVAPENTLAAFRLAVEQGADGVELDVWRCGSGEPVVIHDEDTRRTAGKPIRVRRASLQELAALDVGAWKGEPWRGERIPTLAEVLAALPDAVVNVELKSGGFPDLRLPRAVADTIARHGAGGRAVVSSFDPALLAAFRRAAPSVATGVLFDAEQLWRGRELVGRALGAAAVHPQWQLADDAARMERWWRAGLAVNVWTVDDPAAVARLARLGVSAVITNRPDAARAALSAPRREG